MTFSLESLAFDVFSECLQNPFPKVKTETMLYLVFTFLFSSLFLRQGLM